MRKRRPTAAYSVAIANEQKLLRIRREHLERIARATLADERVTAAEISVALVDDARIHTINRDFLRHDFPTDVISFLFDASESPVGTRGGAAQKKQRSAARSSATRRGTGKSLSGEIIISVEFALHEAARFGWRPVDEVCLYLVHGLLHLCGYDDLSPAERRVMRHRESELLAVWNLVPRYPA